jgi:hypothetical protein
MFFTSPHNGEEEMKVEDLIKTQGVELNNQKRGLNRPKVGCLVTGRCI